MAGFLKQFLKGWGNRGVAEQVVSLDALQIDDHVQFDLLPQGMLSEQWFHVSDVRTCTIGEARQTEWILVDGDRNPIALRVEERPADGIPILQVRRLVPNRLLPSLFGLEDITRLFAEHDQVLTLRRRVELPMFAGWMAQEYHMHINAEQGVVYRGDWRHSAFVPTPDEGYAFDYYLLMDAEQHHAITAEVYNDGVLHLSVMVRLPADAVCRMERDALRQRG
jgi:hypothetical protein